MRLSLLFIIVLQSIDTFSALAMGRIGPYPNGRGIRTDLRRYGLEAGVYSAPGECEEVARMPRLELRRAHALENRPLGELPRKVCSDFARSRQVEEERKRSRTRHLRATQEK